MRSNIYTLIFLLLFILHPFLAYSQSKSAYVINGHKYNMEEDIFFRAVQEWYDAHLDSIGLENLVDSLARENNISVTEFNFPENVDLIYIDDSTGISDIAGQISIEPWILIASGLGCDFVSQISGMGIDFKANSEFINGELIITEIETAICEPVVEVAGSGDLLCPVLADTLKSYLSSTLSEYLQTMAVAFKNVSANGLFDIMSPVRALQLNNPDLIEEALSGFPMDMKIYTKNDPFFETTQLITEVNFLTGTTIDRDAFLGIEPDKNASGLNYGGFSYLYWVLQRGFLWHTEWSETQRVDAAFQVMDDLDIGDYRLELRWRDLQIKAYLGGHLHPDSLALSEIDQIITDIAHWDTSVLTETQNILVNGTSRDLNAFMAIGVGHQDRIPEDGNGKTIAPAIPPWSGSENYIAVSADEYLYNLKIYAHTVVRKFADDIDVWQIENELNAAGFAAADPQWWRKGDLWLDKDFRNRVWDILVSAVRTEDPTARITHDLHMLGFMPAMESWVDDMDIVGVNFYPNQTSAIPVLGFVVGEYVWAVRRVLKGLGYPDKPVWLIETGYPGIEEIDASDSLLLGEDLLYFSEKRQGEFIGTALNSAVENGASGFFYYSLTAQENMPGGIPDLNKFIRYSGLVRRETDEPKPGLDIFAGQLKSLITGLSKGKISEKIPYTNVLHQNYPNPFNPLTNIPFTLTHKTQVELNVYNIHGQKISMLLDTILPGGNHEVIWNASNQASGIYFVQFKAGELILNRKMLLLK